MKLTKRLCRFLLLIGATGMLSGCLNLSMRHPVLREEFLAERAGGATHPEGSHAR